MLKNFTPVCLFFCFPKSCMCYHFSPVLIFVLICLLHCAAQSSGGSHHRLLIRRLPAGHGGGPAEAASRHLSAGVRQAGPETRVSQWNPAHVSLVLSSETKGRKEWGRQRWNGEKGETLGEGQSRELDFPPDGDDRRKLTLPELKTLWGVAMRGLCNVYTS